MILCRYFSILNSSRNYKVKAKIQNLHDKYFIYCQKINYLNWRIIQANHHLVSIFYTEICKKYENN